MSPRQKRRREMAGQGRSSEWRTNTEQARLTAMAGRMIPGGNNGLLTQRQKRAAAFLPGRELLATALAFAQRDDTSRDRGRAVATRHARQSAIASPVKHLDRPSPVPPLSIRED